MLFHTSLEQLYHSVTLLNKTKLLCPLLFNIHFNMSVYFSDLCAGLIGGLGVTPSGNIGQDGAIFESVSHSLMFKPLMDCY